MKIKVSSKYQEGPQKAQRKYLANDMPLRAQISP